MLNVICNIFLIVGVICLTLSVIGFFSFLVWKYVEYIYEYVSDRRKKTLDRRELGKKIFALLVDCLVKCGNKIAWSSEDEKDILEKLDDELFYSGRY